MELPYRLIRSDRRSIALILERDSSLTVRAPRRLPQTAIDAFVSSKAQWVARTRAKAAALAEPPLTVAHGAPLPWLGGTLTLLTEPRKNPFLDGTALHLPEHRAEAALEAWCRAEARAYLSGRAAHFAALMEVAPTGLNISGARSRWGSCSGKNSLNFTWRLLLCSPEEVDYVVVHELSHIRRKNHSPAFWAEVAAVLPDYRRQQARLKARGREMEFL